MKSRLKLTKHGDYERVVLFDVWNYPIRIIFTPDIGKSYAGRFSGLHDFSAIQACHVRGKNTGKAYLFFPLGDTDVGTIAHESWHAIRAMLVDHAGVEIMEDEVTAYHLAYLVRAVNEMKDDSAFARMLTDIQDVKSSTKKR